jgi:hypothetical protein
MDMLYGASRKSVRVPNPRADEPGQPSTVVRKVNVSSEVKHAEVARWPWSFRPPEYNWGRRINCPSY